MGIKAYLHNSQAEEVAGSGDPEVRGMFIGAGRAASAIEDLKLRRYFEDEVVACELDYITKRKGLAERTRATMDDIFHRLLDSVNRVKDEES